MEIKISQKARTVRLNSDESIENDLHLRQYFPAHTVLTNQTDTLMYNDMRNWRIQARNPSISVKIVEL